MALTQVNSGGIKDDSIINADIKSDAAIALSKLASTPAVLTGSTNNTITTVTAANTIQGEANLTFDGTSLKVGASTSTRPISIYSASDAQIQFQGSGTGTGNGNADGFIVGNSGGVDATLWNYENGYLRFATNNAERLRIDSSGNVGIGTTSPSSFNSDGRNLVVGTGSGGQGISIYSANNNYGSIYFADGTSGSELYRGAVLYNHTSDFLRFDTAGGERVRINSSGSVGIGGSPDRNLTLYSAATTRFNLKSANDSTVGIEFGDPDDINIGYLVYDNTDNSIQIGANASEKLRIQSDGHVKINDGDLVIGTAGHGIDFSANSHASAMSSELLDDYEVGEWSPTFYGANTAGTATVNHTTGNYTKIGNLVHLNYYSSAFAMTGSAGTAEIGNLPFTAEAGGDNYSCIVFSHTTCFTSAASGYVNQSQSTMTILVAGDTTTSNTYENSGGKYLMFSVTYRAA